MTSGVTVIVATIPPRGLLLRQALASVAGQTVQPDGIVVEYDHGRTGAAATKNRALAKVGTEWAACLDDDDTLLPWHLETLLAASPGFDVVYSWPEMDGAADPRPDRYGKPFDPDELRRGSFIPTTTLIRAKLAKRVGGYQRPAGSIYDDWGLYLAMLDAGARFVHVPARTWRWRVQGQNTSGQPHRW